MKNFRVLLGSIALLLAGGFTFAGQGTTELTKIAFEYHPNTSQVCRQIETECGNYSGDLCFNGDKQVKENSNVMTSCGIQLRRP